MGTRAQIERIAEGGERGSVVDVAVLGAGPAGAVAARLLADWGHSVVLVDREGGRRPLAESIPPSCIPLLDAAGVRQAIDNAGFIRATGNTVWWGGAPQRVENFPQGAHGFQVLRSAFDDVLQASAVSRGATLMRPATAVRVVDADGTYAVALSTPNGLQAIRAQWVLDCTGRSGVLARTTRRGPGEGLRTIALVAEFDQSGGWSLPDESHTLVESTDWGWGWSVPVSETRRFVTIMLDPSATLLAAGPELEARYRELLSRLPALGPLVQGATRVVDPWACDATPYESREVTGVRTLLVGDAASFIDPLSSFGVKKALASAWLAAVTTHTNLLTPEVGDAALALFSARERDYVTAASRQLGSVSRQANSDRGAFWAARASLDADEVEAASVERLREDPDVLGAFQALRDRATVRLAESPQLRREVQPLIRGNLVVLEDHVVMPRLHTPIRYVRSVDLVAVLEAAVRCNDVGEMYGRYVRRLGPVSLPDFLGALSVAIGKGGLISLDSEPRDP
ncbi:MAG: NAD(P)/FAD-dependent oxidoreductase [Gemmatimonadaceae bacterium]